VKAVALGETSRTFTTRGPGPDQTNRFCDFRGLRPYPSAFEATWQIFGEIDVYVNNPVFPPTILRLDRPSINIDRYTDS
jgi:hypothetical protein